MKQWSDIVKNVSMLTQFGLSLITPLLMCLLICWWMTGRFGLGGWIYIPGFFLGLGGSGTVAWKFYLAEIGKDQSKKKKKRNKVSFNRHL